MRTFFTALIACCILLVMPARTAGQKAPPRQATFGEETGSIARDRVSSAVIKDLMPLLDQMQAAANAHDTDRFMAFYAKGDGLTAMFNGEAIRGWDNLFTQQLKWWGQGKADSVYTMEGPPEFLVLGPDAAVVTLFESSTRTAADGKPATIQLAISMVWQKFLQDGWKIVYSHESTVH